MLPENQRNWGDIRYFDNMSNWKEKALDALHRSLYPVPQELNDIDWKGGLSNKTDRLSQHICAFVNLKGDGVIVFGVNDGISY